jgi:hypothetical protein
MLVMWLAASKHLAPPALFEPPAENHAPLKIAARRAFGNCRLSAAICPFTGVDPALE